MKVPEPRKRPDIPPNPQLDYYFEDLVEYMKGHVLVMVGADRLTDHPDANFIQQLAVLIASAYLDGANAMHQRFSEVQFTSLPENWAKEFVNWRPEGK